MQCCHLHVVRLTTDSLLERLERMTQNPTITAETHISVIRLSILVCAYTKTGQAVHHVGVPLWPTEGPYDAIIRYLACLVRDTPGAISRTARTVPNKSFSWDKALGWKFTLDLTLDQPEFTLDPSQDITTVQQIV